MCDSIERRPRPATKKKLEQEAARSRRARTTRGAATFSPDLHDGAIKVIMLMTTPVACPLPTEKFISLTQIDRGRYFLDRPRSCVDPGEIPVEPQTVG